MPFLWAIGLLIVSSAIQAALGPKSAAPKPAAFGDFDLPTSAPGTPQSVVFGDVWVEDWTILWYGNYRNSPIKSDGSKK